MRGYVKDDKNFSFNPQKYQYPLVDASATTLTQYRLKPKPDKRKKLEFRDAALETILSPEVMQAAKAKATNIGLTPADIDSFVITALEVLSQCDLFVDYLREIEKALRTQGIKGDIRPDYLIAGDTMLAPGLAKNGEHLLDDNEPFFTLSNILLQKEQAAGINVDAKVPIFSGFVEPAIANAFVAAGHVFIEDAQVARGLWHGIHSHRLQIFVLLRRFEQIQFTFDNGNPLTSATLLQLLTHCGLWGEMLDKNAHAQSVLSKDERRDPSLGYINPQTFQPIFSARGPAVLNAFLLCFGDAVGLPCLQQAMLTEHYLHLGSMAQRCLDDAKVTNKSRADIYDTVVSACWFNRYGIDSFDNIYPGLESRANHWPSYFQRYPHQTTIVFDRRQSYCANHAQPIVQSLARVINNRDTHNTAENTKTDPVVIDDVFHAKASPFRMM